MIEKYKLRSIDPVRTHDANIFFFSVSFLAYVAGPFINASAIISSTTAIVNNDVNVCGFNIIDGSESSANIRNRPARKKHTNPLV